MSITALIRSTVNFFAQTRKDDKIMFATLLGMVILTALTVLMILAMVVGLILGLTGVIPMHGGGSTGTIGSHPGIYVHMPKVGIIHVG